MKFVQLKSNLMQGVNFAYLVYGEDAYLRSVAVNLIKNACNIQNADFNIGNFNSENCQFNDLFDIAEQLPFLDNKKIVIYNLYENKLTKDNIDKLTKYIKNPNPSTVLIIISSSSECETDALTSVDCNNLDEATTINWIMSKAQEKSVEIDRVTAKKLSENCGYELTRIDVELVKLAAYCSEKGVIELSDVSAMVTKDLEFQIFALSDAICKKDTISTMKMLEILLSKRDNCSAILSTLTSHFRRLFFTAISTKSTLDTAKLFKMKEYAIKMSAQQAKNFKKISLKKAYELCAETEFKIKSGQTEIDKAIYNLIFQLLNL